MTKEILATISIKTILRQRKHKSALLDAINNALLEKGFATKLRGHKIILAN